MASEWVSDRDETMPPGSVIGQRWPVHLLSGTKLALLRQRAASQFGTHRKRRLPGRGFSERSGSSRGWGELHLPAQPPPAEEIDKLYRYLAELVSRRKRGKRDAVLEGRIRKSFDKLRELQEEEADRIERATAARFKVPLGANDELLRNSEELLRRYEDPPPGHAAAEDPPPPTP